MNYPPICDRHSSEWKKLQRLRRQKRLTPCLELLERHGFKGDEAIFILSAVGGEL